MNGFTAWLNCVEHGAIYIPESAYGGSVYFTGSISSTNYVRSNGTESDARYIYDYAVYRDSYKLFIDGGIYQNVGGSFSVEYVDYTGNYTRRYGGLETWKLSGNTALTAGNSNYSLAGAVYGVYSDPGCTREITSMTTDASGWAGAWGKFESDTHVYMKEKVASKGYELDTRVYTAYIVADQYNRVSTVQVYEAPKTLQVNFYVDWDVSGGSSAPIHVDAGRPLGYQYNSSEGGVVRATAIGTKPNCTPGLRAWYTDKALTQKWNGSRLTNNLDLYARNITTFSYGMASNSPVIVPGREIRASMNLSARVLSLSEILPSSRQANWGTTISLSRPRYETLYWHDGERWRTMRWEGPGWYNWSGGGSASTSVNMRADADRYATYSLSTYDGVVTW